MQAEARDIASTVPLLRPGWSAPPRVGAAMSLRRGGCSAAPWDTMNLGDRVGDVAGSVERNRRSFAAAIGAAPVWLRQVHGTRVLRLRSAHCGAAAEQADAAWTDEPGLACTVQVADCMPVLFAAPLARGVAAAHAGWRGLAAGVLEATLAQLCAGARCEPHEVMAWLGPCIGARRFEVGEDVLRAFGSTAQHFDAALFARSAGAGGSPRWLADLPALARARLSRAGVHQVLGGSWCTFEQSSDFFSYRRDGVTGRHAAAIWIEP